MPGVSAAAEGQARNIGAGRSLAQVDNGTLIEVYGNVKLFPWCYRNEFMVNIDVSATIFGRNRLRDGALCALALFKQEYVVPKCLPRLDGRNHLIATLSQSDQDLIEPHLKDIVLSQGMLLETKNQPVEQIVFPVSGITSIVAFSSEKGRRIEAGLFGRDGMSGTSILLGVEDASNELMVQVPGHGVQISVENLRELLEKSFSLQQHFLKFVQNLLTQTSQTALINKHNSLEERLARWLLMCHDRVEGDRLYLTHEFIGVMLGTRRAGVTIGTQILEGKGVIRAKRGEITILDREGLEEEAGGTYGVPETEYLKIFGRRIT